MNVATESTAADLARAYLMALQAKDKQAILSILAEDFTLEIPCNLSGTNDLSDSWTGLTTADAKYEATFQKIKVLKYVDLEFSQSTDRSVAFAEGLGVMELANGNPYRNRYIFRFDVKDGRIQRIREYLNPITSAIAMGLPLPGREPT
jgi:ketosteroid isomerase-like protein